MKVNLRRFGYHLSVLEISYAYRSSMLIVVKAYGCQLRSVRRWYAQY